MLLSGLIGALFGRYLPDKKYYLLIALAIGFVIGLFGEIGLAYPFFVDINRDLVHIPMVTPYSLFFLHPSIALLDFSRLHYTPLVIPPVVSVTFVAAGIGGVLLGYVIGYRLRPPIRVID